MATTEMEEQSELLAGAKLDFFLEFIPPKTTSQQKGERVVMPKHGGRPFVHHFKKKKVADAEAEIWAMLHPFRPASPFLGPLKLHTLWSWPFLTTHTKAERAAGWQWKDTLPDFDNISKMLCDQMAVLRFFLNDSQICDARVLKKFGETPGIRIILEQLRNP